MYIQVIITRLTMRRKDLTKKIHRIVNESIGFFLLNKVFDLKDRKCEKKHDCPSRTKYISYFLYALFTGGSLNYYRG